VRTAGLDAYHGISPLDPAKLDAGTIGALAGLRKGCDATSFLRAKAKIATAARRATATTIRILEFVIDTSRLLLEE